MLNVWAMLAVMLVHGMVQAIDLPARLAFVPGLVGREDLSNAVALNSLLFNVARAVGPAVAGFLLSAGGAEWCFIVNAISYAAIIVALVLIRLPPESVALTPPSPHGGFRCARPATRNADIGPIGRAGRRSGGGRCSRFCRICPTAISVKAKPVTVRC